MRVPPVTPTASILLVEDDPIVALTERSTLERAGYRVATVADGETAVELALDRADVELVLMDIDLGAGIDGPEAARRILSRRQIPIAFLSAHTEPEIVRRTEEITSYGYIVKNSGDTVLLASVRMAFRLAAAMREIESNRRMLQTILDTSSRLIETLDLQTILQAASDKLVDLTGFDGGAIYLVDGPSFVLRATTPELPPGFPEYLRVARLVDHPHVHRAIESREPVYVRDTACERFTEAETEVVRLRNLRSILYLPLLARGAVIGAFITGSTCVARPVTREVADLCATLANIVAVAAENAIIIEAATEQSGG